MVLFFVERGGGPGRKMHTWSVALYQTVGAAVNVARIETTAPLIFWSVWKFMANHIAAPALHINTQFIEFRCKSPFFYIYSGGLWVLYTVFVLGKSLCFLGNKSLNDVFCEVWNNIFFRIHLFLLDTFYSGFLTVHLCQTSHADCWYFFWIPISPRNAREFNFIKKIIVNFQIQ